mmetsp:Transcript_52686/g.157111  ORF Transcript_52686/g.157111 Transcript_52686/m.157111 type:complete len:213 (-) Transcript_52686:648-1286(-)
MGFPTVERHSLAVLHEVAVRPPQVPLTPLLRVQQTRNVVHGDGVTQEGEQGSAARESPEQRREVAPDNVNGHQRLAQVEERQESGQEQGGLGSHGQGAKDSAEAIREGGVQIVSDALVVVVNRWAQHHSGVKGLAIEEAAVQVLRDREPRTHDDRTTAELNAGAQQADHKRPEEKAADNTQLREIPIWRAAVPEVDGEVEDLVPCRRRLDAA